jgi:hypothetical protein
LLQRRSLAAPHVGARVRSKRWSSAETRIEISVTKSLLQRCERWLARAVTISVVCAASSAMRDELVVLYWGIGRPLVRQIRGPLDDTKGGLLNLPMICPGGSSGQISRSIFAANL